MMSRADQSGALTLTLTLAFDGETSDSAAPRPSEAIQDNPNEPRAGSGCSLNATRDPSGDQVGSNCQAGWSSVRRVAVPLASSIVQMSNSERPLFSIIRDTATRRSSGLRSKLKYTPLS